MPVSISIRSDIRALQRSLDNLAYKQLPFATATALTAIARRAREAETQVLSQVIDRPTQFTMHAYAVKGARKTNLEAVVFAKDRQARYLQPLATGGRQVLGQNRRIATPVEVKLNASGNISKGQIKRLLSRPDVFVGHVNGVGGLWQRPPRGKRRNGGYGTKGNTQRGVGGMRTGLKLLVAFTNPVEVKPVLHFGERAAEVVAASFREEFSTAIARALATAR
ncbi:MAG: hypothetical protein F8N39_11585 [Clostridiaceae bacterium]|nr:hypothetical protein [Clostridiaceae bacterium]